MRSLIIIEVEHGEDTDQLQTLAMLASELPDHAEGFDGTEVIDWTVKVDLPDCFVLDSRNDGQGTCQAHPDIHAFAHNCVGFREII